MLLKFSFLLIYLQKHFFTRGSVKSNLLSKFLDVIIHSMLNQLTDQYNVVTFVILYGSSHLEQMCNCKFVKHSMNQNRKLLDVVIRIYSNKLKCCFKKVPRVGFEPTPTS